MIFASVDPLPLSSEPLSSTPRPNTAPELAFRAVTDSAQAIDLEALSQVIDATGLWAAVLLAINIVLGAGIALATGRVLRWGLSSRQRRRRGIAGGWLRAIVISEILIFLIFAFVAIYDWSQKSSTLSLVAGLFAMSGLVLGFRRSIDNAVAGIMFSIRGSIRHGDSIEVEQVRGTIHQIALTHTQLLGVDGSLYWIPNRILNQSILRIGKTKNVAIITVALPSDLSGEAYEALRLRAYLCPYRRANSPVRIVDRERGKAKLELQTWALRDGTRASAHLESWVEQVLQELSPSPSKECA